MANASAKNVIFVDTNDTTLSRNLTICGIKYIGNTSGTATIKDESSAGAVLWEESGSANVWNQDIEIKANKGVHIALTNSAKVYLYIK